MSANLDTNGVVVISENGVLLAWMHPSTYRDFAGEPAFQEMVARPRVQSEYTPEELEQP